MNRTDLILISKQNNTQLEWDMDGEVSDILTFRKNEQFIVNPDRHTRTGKLSDFCWHSKRWDVLQIPDGYRISKRDETRLHCVEVK